MSKYSGTKKLVSQNEPILNLYSVVSKKENQKLSTKTAELQDTKVKAVNKEKDTTKPHIESVTSTKKTKDLLADYDYVEPEVKQKSQGIISSFQGLKLGSTSKLALNKVK